MNNQRPDKREFSETFDTFARHVDEVEAQFNAIRHPKTQPIELKAKGYRAYEDTDQVVGRMVSNRFDRLADENADRVAASLVMLRLTTEHIETLHALTQRTDAALDQGAIRANIADDKTTFDELLAGYVELMKDGDTAEALQPIRRDINDTLFDLRRRFDDVSVKGHVPYELVTMETPELLNHAGDVVADYVSAMVKLRAFKLVTLKERMDEHVTLYKHADDGALMQRTGVEADYVDMRQRVAEVISECRRTQRAARSAIDNAYEMKEGHVFRPIRLDHTL